MLTSTEAERFYSRIALPDSNGCMRWTGSVGQLTGYGRIKLRGQYVEAHRIACTLANGEAFEGAHAAHACTTKTCVAPDHLSWKTPKENQRDRRRDGTDHYPGARLTRSDVRAIVAAKAEGLRNVEIAAKFGVHITTVRSILAGRTWSRVTGIRRAA